ncbi:prefoldin subunit 6-like isoform X1 [Salvia hispanica]|uniref:prefoldin subunit 6-like isoform X1 n=1 Tax=Salvia hispanica TaxID=49212 RepID=UPI002008F1C0|nr:prefoldin subunit 6-like isoform X1 [Salvia hispanica]XP_047939284.1 prefoldin subunit 6-like isoform X1 [Salvia hispanica]XP_047939285.1 prefoldin subunit 6-like isoform X1 [Salvia hispanica]
MAAIKELTRDLENKANDFRKLEKDIQKNQQVKKKYTIQLGENELVLKELDLLNEDTNVYKLIGPVLVKQDLAEANANVRKRIEYISAELLPSYNKESRLFKLEKQRPNMKNILMITGFCKSDGCFQMSEFGEPSSMPY